MQELMNIEVYNIKKRHEEWTNAESINCTNIYELKKVYKKWLYLEPEDDDFIDTSLAALLDREIPGTRARVLDVIVKASGKTGLENIRIIEFRDIYVVIVVIGLVGKCYQLLR